ncbi:unnamed protein product [Rhizophagus irregularis]|nr:unnamed protein product [Rhizophagus irregularis]
MNFVRDTSFLKLDKQDFLKDRDDDFLELDELYFTDRYQSVGFGLQMLASQTLVGFLNVGVFFCRSASLNELVPVD